MPRVVQYLDLYPTLVDLCGLPAASWLEGTSLVPLLEQPQSAWDRPVYTEWAEGRRGTAVFGHQGDPHETRNVAGDSCSRSRPWNVSGDCYATVRFAREPVPRAPF